MPKTNKYTEALEALETAMGKILEIGEDREMDLDDVVDDIEATVDGFISFNC